MSCPSAIPQSLPASSPSRAPSFPSLSPRPLLSSSLPAEQKLLAQIFCSTSAQTQPFPSDGSDRHIQPHGRAGDTPGCPYPCPGLRSPLLGHAAGREAGSCSQLQAQQQQPLLFHTSVFLALLCISVQELKLRSLAEVLSVVTALRAVVRHSLSLSLARSLSPFCLFFFFLFPPPQSLQLGSTPRVWIRCSCQDKGPKVEDQGPKRGLSPFNGELC